MLVKRQFVEYAMSRGFPKEEVVDENNWGVELRIMYKAFLAGYTSAALGKHE